MLLLHSEPDIGIFTPGEKNTFNKDSFRSSSTSEIVLRIPCNMSLKLYSVFIILKYRTLCKQNKYNNNNKSDRTSFIYAFLIIMYCFKYKKIKSPNTWVGKYIILWLVPMSQWFSTGTVIRGPVDGRPSYFIFLLRCGQWLV